MTNVVLPPSVRFAQIVPTDDVAHASRYSHLGRGYFLESYRGEDGVAQIIATSHVDKGHERASSRIIGLGDLSLRDSGLLAASGTYDDVSGLALISSGWGFGTRMHIVPDDESVLVGLSFLVPVPHTDGAESQFTVPRSIVAERSEQIRQVVDCALKRMAYSPH